MVKVGYALSSEEHGPGDLVRHAQRAEASGFEFALISDHYHPWTDRQGQSPFVWTILGAIGSATTTLPVGTGVTCPILRIHPAVIAQAAATCAALMPGRFFLGVGTGEQLNEHILGQHWPATVIRREMLREAITLLRTLWSGELTTHMGRYYTVENARIYTLPDDPIAIAVAAGGTEAATLAGEIGDALVATSPAPDTIEAFAEAGGAGKPRYGQLTVCYAATEEEGRRIAYEWWPNAALEGELGQELPLPRHFEEATGMVTETDVAEKVVCGPDPERHLAAIGEFAAAGFDHVYVHQVGPAQDAFIDFYSSEILGRTG